MSVISVSPYKGVQQDTAEKFPAPLLYIGWEDHLMFCAPFCVPAPPTMTFGDLITQVLPGVFGEHPDFANINWEQVNWFKSGEFWMPNKNKTLAENGLGHKDVIRMRTPGMKGLSASCS
jgi:phenol hydroxylase P4 protein